MLEEHLLDFDAFELRELGLQLAAHRRVAEHLQEYQPARGADVFVHAVSPAGS